MAKILKSATTDEVGVILTYNEFKLLAHFINCSESLIVGQERRAEETLKDFREGLDRKFALSLGQVEELSLQMYRDGFH